ncbi:Disintegrin and metalloproteinase domain-containing protein 10 [Goodea atripinnis]|uniref:Disintegrin and metalloproteinase domain-containing protein 10 n=1 Tax=Goodea atripinnis TaxID=208336 RepID=A0ABV0PIG3_9TELE
MTLCIDCRDSSIPSGIHVNERRKSLNTGIITVQNYASHVPPKVSHITFAHEIGHNFGSPVSWTMAHTKLLCVLQTVYMLPVLQHDSGSECTPGESVDRNKKELGNYVMYARATSGDKINNNKFSICSIRNISAVLLKKRDSCFVGKLSLINKVEKLCGRFCFNQVCISTQSLVSLSAVMD